MRRWTSEGGSPGRRPLYPSREGSIPAASREVRCACQYFQSDSLLPERYNPVGSRPTSPVQSIVDNKSYLSDYSQQPADYTINIPSSESNVKPVENASLINTLYSKNIPNAEVFTNPPRVFQNFYNARSRPASAHAQLQSDHEYEPVGKPPAESNEAVNPVAMNVTVVESAGETPLTTEKDEAPEWMGDDASSTTSHERQFLHPANEEDIDTFGAIESEEDAHNAALQLQKELEDRYFVNTPTTTESRTDCEISTSQVDSSAIENLPLKRESRKKNSVAQETAKLRQRISSQTGKIKNHAGKIKTKLKTIKKPQFNLPERPKLNLPERPKFNLPERPKFNLPERPKINLPERPKFHLPERPKFNLPERPKFNFPERPKFKMPERPKINFPDRPKLSFPDKAKFSFPDKSKFKLPDRPKLNFSSFNRSKENRSSVDDATTTEPSVSSKKNFLDFDFRTYPRIFNKNKKKREPSGERPGTPPPPGFATVPRITKDRKEIVASHWEHASSKTTDDEPRHYGIEYSYDKEPDFQTKLAQVDKDYREMQQEAETTANDSVTRATLENKEIWNAIERNTVQQMEHRSSLPQLQTENDNIDKYDDDESSAASVGQHRRGVLEEINNDEFFLRQKGISQDNIEVGKYLSNEIRDAFRYPVNALNQIDNNNSNFNSSNMQMDVDNDFETKYKDDSDEHLCLEDENNQNNLMSENDDGYYTFPPIRPSRAKKLKTLVQELPKEKIAIAHDESIEDIANMHIETIPTQSIFSDIPKNMEQESNLENFQKRIFGSSFKEPEILDSLNEYENEIEQTKEVPTIPKRRRRNPAERYSESESFINDNIDSHDWTDQKMMSKSIDVEDQVPIYRVEPVIPTHNEGTPVIPRRSRSRGSRTTSMGDDDRTSRGAESLTLDSHVQMNNEDLDYMDDLDDGPGYAIVDKTVQPKEEESLPPRPPPPMRKHRSAKSLSGDRQFFTVPRSLKDSSPPKRPTRNYSTLGPSRPPRKKSTTSLTGLDSIQKTTSSGDVTQYVEIEDDDGDSQKNLKSGDVVSKMKDRPLPPPPRPPRGPKRKKDEFDVDIEKEIDDNIKLENDLSYDPTLGNEMNTEDDFLPADNNNNIELLNANLSTFINSKEENIPYEIIDQEQVIEIEVSTQTDPLPDDFDYDLGIDEPLSESYDIKGSDHDLTKEEAEENSIDIEIMSKGLQKFRESSRPSSRSSKLKSPTERPKTPLGRMSPTAILVERRVSSPTRINQHEEIVTQASLTVQPIDEPEIIESQVIPPERRYYPTAFDILHSTNVPQALLDHSEQQKEIKHEEDVKETEILPVMQTTEALQQDTLPPSQQEQTQPLLQDTSNIPEQILLNLRPTKEPEYISQDMTPKPEQSTTLDASQATGTAPTCNLNSISQISNQLSNQINLSELDVLKTQKLQVTDLDVERLNVSELQATKILVSEIEGLSLQINDVNSKSGHIYVRGIELAPNVIEDLLERFAQMIPTPTNVPQEITTQEKTPQSKVDVNQETQTEELIIPSTSSEAQAGTSAQYVCDMPLQDDAVEPPPRPPPPPTINPSMFQPIPCYPDFSMPSSSYYRYRRPIERRQDNLSDDEHPPPARRKHRREHKISSSEDEDYKPIARRVPAPARPPESSEPSVSDLSIQLFRACQNSVSRTLQHIISYIRKHFGEVQSKKEVEMAIVIFLVMAAGLIILSINDGRAIHHHHWDFINPPDGKN